MLLLLDSDPSSQALLARQALHAARLVVDHPRTGVRMAFEAPLPAVVTVVSEVNEPRIPGLMQIMKAKSKPIANTTPADYGVDMTPRLTTLKVTEPAKRQAGIKVKSVDELVAKLKEMGAVA
jgi:electron transfer flavoprotein alpha/beta subunit